MTGKPKVFWTDVETAFILNHADTCLKQQEDYNKTVSERLTAYVKREITKDSVKIRLQRVLRDNNQKHTPGTFIPAGTACLNQLLLPSSLLEEMKSQRKKMGLEDMSAADVPAKTASQVPTSHASSSIAPINTLNKYKRRATTRDSDDSCKTYREDSVSDSVASSFDDASDIEVIGQSNKRRKLNPKPSAESAVVQRGKSSQAGPATEYKQSTTQATASAAVPPAIPGPAQQRKLSPAVVIDIGSASAAVPPARPGPSRPPVVTDKDSAPTAVPPTIPGPSRQRKLSPTVVIDKDSASAAVPQAVPGPSRQRKLSPAMVTDTNSASAAIPRAVPELARKRKAAQAVVNYTDSASPPPPKRHAASKLSTKTSIASKVPAARQPHPKARQPSSGPSQVQHFRQTSFQSHTAPAAQTYLGEKAQAAPIQSADEMTTRDMIKDLSSLVGCLVREVAKVQEGTLSDEVVSSLNVIERTITSDPGQLLDKMLQDLRGEERANKEMLSMLHGLYGSWDVSRKNTFPRTPEHRNLDRDWKALFKEFQDAFGFVLNEPKPKGVDVGYVAARIDDLMKDGLSSVSTPPQFPEELAPHLHSPHLVQAALGALLCRWLFIAPEPMCKDVYSDKEMNMFRALLINDGAADVQLLDKLGMKLLFEDERFQKSKQELRAEVFLERVKAALKKVIPAVPGIEAAGGAKDWAKMAVKLKKDLMISQHDYRLHYCKSTTPFDFSWMTPVDSEGFTLKEPQTQGKRVAACLFPALVQQDPLPFEDSVTLTDLLVCNKNFFPTFAEKQAFDPKKVISKATVLLM